MHRRWLNLSLNFLFALGCARGSQLGSSNLGTSDLDVYRAVLDSMFVPRLGGRITRLVVKDSTAVRRREELVGGVIEGLFRLPGVDSTAVRDFEARNRRALSLKALGQFELSVHIVLVNDQTLSDLPQDAAKYWGEFYRRYPGSSGHIAFSAIGYSADGSLAVLMIDRGCGMLCGNGYIVSVRRSGGRWRIANIQGTWIS